jgi:hypothetical protein
MQEPTVSRALGAGFRAVAGEPWVAVAGMAVTLFRGALALPGTAFVVAVSWLAVGRALERGGGPDAALTALLSVWQAPRFRSIAIGLWLVGILLWGALRLAWVAGAVPLVAWRLAGSRGEEPVFAQGAAWRFHRVLPAAVVALLLDLVGRAMILAAALGVLAVGFRAQGSASPGAAALVAAFGLAASAVLATSLSAVGDVAVARAAIAGEGAGRAVVLGARAFLARPAAFLVAVLAVGLATGFATGALQGALSAMGSVARRGPATLQFLPQMLLAVLSALLAAGAELWRLSAVGVLALSRQSGRETRWMSLRSESLGMRPPSQ